MSAAAASPARTCTAGLVRNLVRDIQAVGAFILPCDCFGLAERGGDIVEASSMCGKQALQPGGSDCDLPTGILRGNDSHRDVEIGLVDVPAGHQHDVDQVQTSI